MIDPIVEKIHTIRQQHADKFNNDPERIFEDFKQKEQAYAGKLVYRKPKLIKKKAV